MRAREGFGILGVFVEMGYFPLHQRTISAKLHECFSLRNIRRMLGQTALVAETAFDEYNAADASNTREHSGVFARVCVHLTLGVSNASASDASSVDSS